ncbi:MAG TPA: hypothetical protein VGB55_00575, partial [Tepidisphaeraceae bacterium]
MSYHGFIHMSFLNRSVIFALICVACMGAQTMAQIGMEPKATPDAGVEVVRHFYRMLLDEKEPTMEDEHALFPRESGIRSRLMIEGRPEDEPLVCQYFKKQRDRFMPKREPDRPLDINITHLFNYSFRFEVDKPQPKEDQGKIQVIYDV